MPKRIEVRYADILLGEVESYGADDWRNPGRAPSEADFTIIRARAAADFLHGALGRHPLKSHPREPEVPWPVVILRAACRELVGRDSRSLEEAAMRTYLVRYGLDRFVEIWGGDPGELARDLDRAASEDSR